jgi:hypothetical protein
MEKIGERTKDCSPVDENLQGISYGYILFS